MSEHKWEVKPGEGPHGEYAEQCSVCGMWDADKAADQTCPGSAMWDSDLAVAIGEHAFTAGWDAAVKHFKLENDFLAHERAWSDYDPPEELKGGGPL